MSLVGTLWTLLESFFPALALGPSVQAALHKEFGERAQEILDELEVGFSIPDDAHNVITDLVRNESSEAETLYGLGHEGEFSINIMCNLDQFIGSKR